MNIYYEARKLDIEIDSHTSDMYIPVTDETRNLVSLYEFKQNVTTFKNEIDGTLWFDIPFAYEPYWHQASKAVESWAKNGSI